MDSPTTDPSSPSPLAQAEAEGKSPVPDRSVMPVKGGFSSGLANLILDAVGFNQRSAWKAEHLVGVGEGFEAGRGHGVELGRVEGAD